MSARYAAPLRAVDEMRVTTQDGQLVISASKEVRADDPYLPAHFPGRTIYPGVFIVETVRQAVLAALGEQGGEPPSLSAVHSLRFTSALHPGERLRVTATVSPAGPDGAVRVEARCGREEGSAGVARMVLEFQLPGRSEATGA